MHHINKGKISKIISSIWSNTWAIWCCAIFLFILYIQKINQNMTDNIRNIFSEYIVVVNGKIDQNINSALSLYEYINSFVVAKKENENLTQKLIKLEQYYYSSKMMENENKKLKELLNVVTQKEFKFITANIYYYVDNPYTKNIVINAGKKHGVKKNNLAINENGVVGRIVDVGDDYSRILLINDPNSRIPIITEHSSERAIAIGGLFGKLNLEYLADEHGLEEGELVFTSGEIENFPSGILVGILNKDNDSEFSVSPVVDLNHLDYVVVITN